MGKGGEIQSEEIVSELDNDPERIQYHKEEKKEEV